MPTAPAVPSWPEGRGKPKNHSCFTPAEGCSELAAQGAKSAAVVESSACCLSPQSISPTGDSSSEEQLYGMPGRTGDGDVSGWSPIFQALLISDQSFSVPHGLRAGTGREESPTNVGAGVVLSLPLLLGYLGMAAAMSEFPLLRLFPASSFSPAAPPGPGLQLVMFDMFIHQYHRGPTIRKLEPLTHDPHGT